MANSLLDFVMALVRDPDAAARYAADPAGALAAAQLPGVTIADVNNLMPVVTDSLAAATPGFGVLTDVGPATANIWASGAAAAAFDAFDIHRPPDLPPAEQGAPTISVPPVQVSAGPVAASVVDAVSPISPGGDDPAFPFPQSFGEGGGEDGWQDGWQPTPHVDPQPEAADPPRFDLS